MQLLPVVDPRRHHAEARLPPARRDQRQDPPHAHALLRAQHRRRRALAHHQRRRHHVLRHGAVGHAACHERHHARRRAGHDAAHQLAHDAHRAHRAAGHGRAHGPDRQAQPALFCRPAEEPRRYQRQGRGDLRRAQRCLRLQPRGRDAKGVRRHQRAALPLGVEEPVFVRAHVAGDDVCQQARLRVRGRARRLACRARHHHDRRHSGISQLHGELHAADHAAGADQHAAADHGGRG